MPASDCGAAQPTADLGSLPCPIKWHARLPAASTFVPSCRWISEQTLCALTVFGLPVLFTQNPIHFAC